jgi:DNA-binding transcriptional MerR regulator
MKKLYLVKDLARITGYSTNTIKFYLLENLIQEFARSPYTNFRIFDEESVRRLHRIRVLRKEGASIEEIRSLLIKPQKEVLA